MNMQLLQVSGVHKQEGGNTIVNNVSFTQQTFQKIAIAGESGSGKSTLMKMIGGLVQPDSGEILFEGKRIEGPNEKLIPGHPQIAYLSQHFELRNNYRVEEILEYANTLSEKEAAALYNICHIGHLLKRKTDQVSGGEKQRIAMARLLIGAPKLFLLDEPFSNLDMLHRNVLRSVIHNMGEKLRITCMMVSHDPADMLSWADQIIVMKSGLIVQQGAPAIIYQQPVNEYVAGLFGKYNLIQPEQAATLGIPQSPVAKKQTIFRPGCFKLTSTKTKTATAGIVQDIHFLGDSYDVDVQLPDIMLTVRTDTAKFGKGDKVYVSWK